MKISKDAQRTARQLLKATIVDGKVDAERARGIVRRIAEKKPRDYFGILSAYVNLLRLELAKRHAVVESAVELDEGVRHQVMQDLKRKYGEDLTFEFTTDPQLLGGMRVKVGSDVWDGTVRARLEQLREAFTH